jgi:crotonobetainyl-CoA:carnitine CoA-transferase CaiB-like acyl-CoA transferase
MGPLKGIRVLDLSRVLAGPWAGQVFADMGAEVIKVERPGAGDDTRAFGPPWISEPKGGESPDSAYYASANRGKRAVTVDFGQKEGQDIVRAMALQCDVLIENYKVDTLARYRLDYTSIKEINPRLIYCSITGFGQTGPYRTRPGYDGLIQAMGGLMSITGESDHLPGGGPQRVGVALVDIVTGLYASSAVLGALYSREQTDQGQHIDIALLDSLVAALANQGLNWLIGGVVPGRSGTAHSNMVPSQVFKSADGYILLSVGNDEQYRRFCAVAGRQDLADDPRYTTTPGRSAHREELVAVVAQLMRQRRTAEWVALLEGAGVPSGPINTIDKVFEDPQVQARGMRLDLPHPVAGTVASIASPIRYSGTPIEYGNAPPVLGQHTDEILRGMLGFSSEDIARLRAVNVL